MLTVGRKIPKALRRQGEGEVRRLLNPLGKDEWGESRGAAFPLRGDAAGVRSQGNPNAPSRAGCCSVKPRDAGRRVVDNGCSLLGEGVRFGDSPGLS